MSHKAALILNGCGVFDGSEIHETVAIMLALSQARWACDCYALDKPFTPIDHIAQTPQSDTRSMLVEAARIARGEIQSLTDLDVKQYDALIFPGGFGVAKNFCTYAQDQAQCTVDETIEQVMRDAHDAGVAQGFICVSPILAARVFGDGIEVTIGHDETAAAHIEAMGAKHIPKNVDEAVIDTRFRVVTSPAYFLATSVEEVYQSVQAMMKGLISLV